MKLGANGGFMQISKSAGSIQWMICWWPTTCGDERKPWKVSKLQRQGPVPIYGMLISQAHLPTTRCSKSQRCFKPWIAESQVKQVVRRYKLWRIYLNPSNFCKSWNPWLEPVNTTNQTKDPLTGQLRTILKCGKCSWIKVVQCHKLRFDCSMSTAAGWFTYSHGQRPGLGREFSPKVLNINC